MMSGNKLFDEILQGLTETHRIDFKESCEWDIRTFIKDFLSFANIEGGGYLVIGVKETGNVGSRFVAEGITSTHKATYDYDIMKDQVAPYADPHIKFSIFIHTWEDKEFVFIEIEEFDDIPTICIRNNQNADVFEGSIYFRSQKGRPNSKRVSSAYDLRDILDRASYKLKQKRIGYEASIPESEKDKFDEERGNL